MNWLGKLSPLLFALPLLVACSDDGGPHPDGKVGDGPGVVHDGPPVTSDGELPWPDLASGHDSTPWKCTPGQAEMCDGYKTQYCNAGTCANCPPGYTDCDRQGDCECPGICDGAKCVKP